MSESKRYYWLKLKEDFFEDDTITFIEEQANGEKYTTFYLKLCCKALKYEGRLIRYVGETLIPYDEYSLAMLTKTDVDTVRVALALFQKIGLVERLETGELYLSQLAEMTGTECDTAARMRRSRARKNQESFPPLQSYAKALQSYNEVTPKRNNVTDKCNIVQKCYTDIEIEKEIEKEKEFEHERNELGGIPSGIPPTAKQVYDFYLVHRLNILPSKFYKYQTSRDWKDENGNEIKNWRGAYIAMNEADINSEAETPEHNPNLVFDFDEYR